MDAESKQKVKDILENGPEGATPEDIIFLTARRSYLTNEQRRTFGIKGPVVKKEVPANPGETVAPEGTGKDEDVRVAQDTTPDEQTESAAVNPATNEPVNEEDDVDPSAESGEAVAEEETTEASEDPEDEYSDVGDADPDSQG